MAMIYCRECGARHSDKVKKCPKCGCVEQEFKKTVETYLLLNLFLGIFGVHRIYSGKICSGVLMFLATCTVYGIALTAVWSLIDFIIGICNLNNPDKIFPDK